MPQVHYPFIDIAVHPAVRMHFAAGDAVVLFSSDMSDVVWANGEGARLFGHREIYDLLEGGPERGGVAFRQLAAAAAQLAQPGDRRGFVMRITSGFKSTAVQAEVNLITVGRDTAVMFSAAGANGKAGLGALLSGFDDPDTHMAVLGSEGDVRVASAGFAHLGISQDTSRALISAAARSGEGLIKRPIPSGSGYLPAAVGKLSDELYLLFCVETSIGRMDAPEDSNETVTDAAPAAALIEPVAEFLHEPEVAETRQAENVIETATDDVAAENASDVDGLVPIEPATAESPNEPMSFVTMGQQDDANDETRTLAADTEQAPDISDVADEADVAETEEGAAEEDLGDLAAIDGATPEDIEAASIASEAGILDMQGEALSEEQASEPQVEQPGEFEADAAENDTLLQAPGIESPELTDDVAESASFIEQAPEEFGEVSAHDVVASETASEMTEIETANGTAESEAAETSSDEPATDESDAAPAGDEPIAQSDEASELATDIAEASDSDSTGDMPEVDSPELAADMAETSDAAAEEFVGSDVQTFDTDAGTDGNEEIGDEAEPVADSADVVAPEPTAAEGDEEQPFSFDRTTRPVRFVWKLDAHGTFAEVSDEFARTVGPHSGNIVGQSFRDLAALFDLDDDAHIAGLLERRDTWSGRTVKWPVEGTDLVVPVDLAALPTYSRNREFDGFRGFGIIRVGDVETDPHGFGLSLKPDDTIEEQAAELETDAPASEPDAPMDEFRGEVPALDIVSNPLATFSDKIIKLEERRAKSTRDGLSASEQAALKEIARQLEPFGKRPNEDVIKSTSGLLQTEDVADATDERFEDAQAQGEQTIAAMAADTEDLFDDFNAADDGDRFDEQSVQSLFEDLGTGPGLTAYALDQVPMAILIHAGDRLIEANSEFRRLTGYDTIADLEREGGLDALITRREGPDAGVYLVRADGTQVLVSARLQSVRYEGSSALMLALTPAAGTLAAVTTEPQVIAESESHKIAGLKVEIDELHSILETATDGVVVLDTEGRIRSMNRSASALFNFDEAETRGKPFAMLFAHESQKSVQDYLAGLAGHGVASVLNDGRELIGREASGGFIPLFMTMGRMPGSNSYCAVIRDITQWKRSEEELRSAKRAAETANQHKSDFLARVSHEIRTPLNAIIGFSDMIASEHFGPAGHSRYVEYASDIGRSGRHVLDIVNDLLDISKIEAGEMDLDFTAVGVNDCVSEAVSLVQPQANAQRVIIRTSLSQSVPEVVADLRSIKQIALNILANAIRYTPSGGQIVVSTAYEPSGSVTLRIRDTGVGMSKAELDQAMKPFGQVASGTRQRGDGTGLGLPLTKAMTEANRASFAIHSAPNEGTLVEITFPPQRVLAD
jgi:PAS domain S-box-containing protein